MQVKIRCEHNCHLCKKEWLGRCFGKYYGKDVSMAGETDVPVCDEYVYGGSEQHLKEIEVAEALGVTHIYIDRNIDDDNKQSINENISN